jgi:hypothetical protein
MDNKDSFQKLNDYIASDKISFVKFNHDFSNVVFNNIEIFLKSKSQINEVCNLLDNVGIERLESNDYFRRASSKNKIFSITDNNVKLALNKAAIDFLTENNLDIPSFVFTKFNKDSVFFSNLIWNFEKDKIDISYNNEVLKIKHSSNFSINKNLNDMGLKDLENLEKLNSEKFEFELENSLFYNQTKLDDGNIETNIIGKKNIEILIKKGLLLNSSREFDGNEMFYEDFKKAINSTHAKIILESIPKPTQQEIDEYILGSKK